MPTTHVPVRSEVSRSWLLVAGRATDRFDVVVSVADQMILDIEDAVEPAAKDAARADVVAWLRRGGAAWVRVNDRSTAYWEQDLAALSTVSGVKGIVLAKVESADAVTETFDALGGRTPVIALIESALGIEEAVNIARARGTHRLAFGSGDYRRDTDTSADDLAMAYPRSRLVVASRVGGLPGPIDGPTLSHEPTVLRQQSLTARALGLTGKLCLQADQAPIVDEVFSPSEPDIAWAQTFLDEFEAAGGVIRDGGDPPRLARASRLLALDEEFAAARG